MSNFATTCRTCMKTISSSTLVNISEALNVKKHLNISIVEALLVCTPTQVSILDDLPQQLCIKCMNTLEISYLFRKKAIKSEEKLKKVLSQSKPDLVQVKVENVEADINIVEEFDDYKNYDFNDVSMDQTSTDLIEYDKNYDEEKEIVNNLQEDETTCPICSEKFYKYSLFQLHLNEHNAQEKTYECKICQETFQRESLLLRHMVAHSNNIELKIKNENGVKNKFNCTQCNMSFAREKSLSCHMRKHRYNRLRSNKIDVEIKEENSNLQFKCSKCDMSFAFERSLSSHMKKHGRIEDDTEFRKHNCETCGKEYKSKQMLTRHMMLHSDNRQYKCSKCPKSYTRADQLRDHLNKHVDVKTKVCPYCNKTFSQLCNLKDHVRIHTGETPYLCSNCGKGFNNSSNLRQHMIRHSGVKPYSCKLCPKTFSTKGQVASHMSTHTRARPYKCGQCGAAFTKSNSLKKHNLIHLGIKPFACDTCNMRFTIKDHLQRHYRVHTGEKPFRCLYCDRSFAQSNDLVKHTRTHVGQNIYRCTVCDMRFRLVSELTQHYPTHYVNSNEPIMVPIAKNLNAPVAILKPSSEDTIQNADVEIKLNEETEKITTKFPVDDMATDGQMTVVHTTKDNQIANGHTGAITVTFNNEILAKSGDLTGGITINIEKSSNCEIVMENEHGC